MKKRSLKKITSIMIVVLAFFMAVNVGINFEVHAEETVETEPSTSPEIIDVIEIARVKFEEGQSMAVDVIKGTEVDETYFPKTLIGFDVEGNEYEIEVTWKCDDFDNSLINSYEFTVASTSPVVDELVELPTFTVNIIEETPMMLMGLGLTEVEVGTLDELRSAVASAEDGDTIIITNDITWKAGDKSIDFQKPISLNIVAENPVTLTTVDSKHFEANASIKSLFFKNLILDGGAVEDSGPNSGGIAGWNAQEITVENVTIRNCKSDTNGAGIYLSGTDLTLINSTIENNYATNISDPFYPELKDSGYGGGIYLEAGGDIIVTGENIVRNNKSLYGGAGISTHDETGAISINAIGDGDRLIIENNETTDVRSYGGGFFASSYIELTGDIQILGNRAAQGGGLYTRDSIRFHLTYADIVISDNYAVGSEEGYTGGGGIALVKDEVNFKTPMIFFDGDYYLIMENNVAQGGSTTSPSHGGAIYMEASEGGMTFRNVKLNKNKATGYGGGIYVAHELGGLGFRTLMFTNVESTNNNASKGGGVYISTSARELSVYLYGATEFNKNEAVEGGGLYFKANEDIRIMDLSSFSDSIVFSKNKAEKGGALNIDIPDKEYTDFNGIKIDGAMSFEENYADEGGAIYIEDYELLGVDENIVFSGNTASYEAHNVLPIHIDTHGLKINTLHRSASASGSPDFTYLYNNYDIYYPLIEMGNHVVTVNHVKRPYRSSQYIAETETINVDDKAAFEARQKNYPGYYFNANASDNKKIASVTGDKTITLYYDEITYYVTYDGNGASLTNAHGTTWHASNEEVRVGPSLVRKGYVFSGWKSSADNMIYSSGGLVKVTDQHITLVAQWKKVSGPKPTPTPEETPIVSETPTTTETPIVTTTPEITVKPVVVERDDDCWIHWLMLLIVVVYSVYGGIRIYSNKQENDDLQDMIDEVEIRQKKIN